MSSRREVTQRILMPQLLRNVAERGIAELAGEGSGGLTLRSVPPQRMRQA